MIKRARGIQVMISAILTALPALFNVASMLFLNFFVFAILGMTLFGNVRFGGALNENANFRNFGSSLLLLIRMVTGESWNYVMKDCMVEPPYCTDWTGPTNSGMSPGVSDGDAWYWNRAHDPKVQLYLMNDCGSAFLAKLYFISFYIISNYAMMNLFVAVILDNFAFAVNMDLSFVKPSHLHKFKQTWYRFTADESSNSNTRGVKRDGRYMPLIYLNEFCSEVGAPLGIPIWNAEGRNRFRLIRSQCRDSIAAMPKQEGVNNGVTYHDLLRILCIQGLSWQEGELPYDEYMDRREEEDIHLQVWAASMFQSAFRAGKKRTAMGMAKKNVGMSAEEKQRNRFKQSFLSKISQSQRGTLESTARLGAPPKLKAPPPRSLPNRGQDPDSVMIEMNSMPSMGTVTMGSPSPTARASPRHGMASPGAGPQSPGADPHEAAIEITEVRNLFRDRAQKRKQAKEAKGMGGGVVRL